MDIVINEEAHIAKDENMPPGMVIIRGQYGFHVISNGRYRYFSAYEVDRIFRAAHAKTIDAMSRRRYAD